MDAAGPVRPFERGTRQAMTAVGIDLGAHRLRVAHDGAAGGSVAVRSVGGRLPFVVEPAEGGAGWQITSLKRALDVDRALPLPAGPLQTVELTMRLLRAAAAAVAADAATRCAVAVPPCFSQRQRSTLRDAVVTGGFTRVRLVDDTLATLLGATDLVRENSAVVVCQWGAGTLSAALYAGSTEPRTLISHAGSRMLGTDDLDAATVGSIAAALGSRAMDDPHVLQRAALEAERVRDVLLAGSDSTVALAALLGVPTAGRVTVSGAATREALASMLRDASAAIDTLLGDGRPHPGLVLAGGSMTLLGPVRDTIGARLGAPGRARERGRRGPWRASLRASLPKSAWQARDAVPVGARPARRAAGTAPVLAVGTKQRSTLGGRGPKQGRNEQCACGSGRKFKRCCGAYA